MKKEERLAARSGDLFRALLKERNIDLTEVRSEKFTQACKRVIIEYPGYDEDEKKQLASKFLDVILENQLVNVASLEIKIELSAPETLYDVITYEGKLYDNADEKAQRSITNLLNLLIELESEIVDFLEGTIDIRATEKKLYISGYPEELREKIKKIIRKQ